MGLARVQDLIRFETRLELLELSKTNPFQGQSQVVHKRVCDDNLGLVYFCGQLVHI